MSGGTQKVCPRKFSEKIALLNKKEAEGNAKFEEIIKEVQATKSSTNVIVKQCDQGIDGLIKQDDNSRNELEEVFESLIKCVGQYEEELLETQAQKFGSIQAFPENSQLFGQTNELSTRSASAELFPNQMNILSNSMGIPYNLQQQSSNHDGSNNSIQVLAQSIMNNQSNDLTYSIPCGNQQHQQQASRVFSSEVKNSFNDQVDNTMRTRVTSIGSANCQKYIRTGMQQSIKNDRVCQIVGGDWQDSSGVYLSEPNQEKSWQKSSSVPALHVQHVPLSCGTPGSNNSLAGSPMRQVNQCSQVIKDELQPRNQPTNDTNCSSGYIREQRETTESFAAGPELLLSKEAQAVPVTCYHTSQTSSQSQGITGFLQHRQQQTPSPMDIADSDNSQLGPDSVDLAGPLPGIKICAFEDENSRHLLPARVDLSNNSQPDITSLQFTGQNAMNNDDCVGHGRDEHVKPYSECSDTQLVLYSDQQMDNVQQSAQQKDEKQCVLFTEQHPAQYDGGTPKYIPYNVNTPGAPASSPYTTVQSGPVCAKLTNAGYNLSNSIGVLANTGQNNMNTPTSDLNIIRSHSHSSIDNLSKHKMQANHSNGRSNPYQRNHPGDHSQQSYTQYQDRNHRNNLKACPRNQHPYLFDTHVDSKCYGSNSSMQPQYGSVSPFSSSGNLTSPQSNQDSPGSCEAEQIDLNNNNSMSNLYDLNQTNENMASSINEWQYATQQANYEPIPAYQCDSMASSGAYQCSTEQSQMSLGQETMTSRGIYELKPSTVGVDSQSTGYTVITSDSLANQQDTNQVHSSVKVFRPTSGDIQRPAQLYPNGPNDGNGSSQLMR